MRATHEHEFEAALGLPEELPKGEQILWQGSPNWISLGVEAFHLRSLGIYFGLMLLLQLSYLSGQEEDWSAKPLLITAFMVILTLGTLWAWSWMSAKASMYTITNKRVVMRVGVVYSLTFNLPLKQIIGAHELHRRGGTSDLSLTLKKEDRIGWLHLWPHSRPWVLNHPEPTIRCIPDGALCADILKSAWLEVNKDIEVSVAPKLPSTVEPNSTPNSTPNSAPNLATAKSKTELNGLLQAS